MPGGYARKRMHDGHTRLRRRLRLRNKTKDLDQVRKSKMDYKTLNNPQKYLFLLDRHRLEGQS